MGEEKDATISRAESQYWKCNPLTHTEGLFFRHEVFHFLYRIEKRRVPLLVLFVYVGLGLHKCLHTFHQSVLRLRKKSVRRKKRPPPPHTHRHAYDQKKTTSEIEDYRTRSHTSQTRVMEATGQLYSSLPSSPCPQS